MIALPLNLIFYILLTSIGLTLIIKTEFLGHILSTFLFAFLGIWISDNSILNIELWYIQTYNSTSGNFTFTNIQTPIITPLNDVLIIVNIGLSLASSIIFFMGLRIQRDS